ncbi:cytochrome-c peroxidase [Neisseria weaveri]|uniref:Protein CcpR n=1 Tax=Neisseria weaveri TaxID=28091 RepID=A0A3S4ZDQ4_9NEIS|nr:cytochrome-c peroxidase [Neisseria weaveri]EGV37528.1 CcpR [Neisseria weaveri LMG 5135]VEJ51496.1 protein CcpR [Neisseria weaveri]
MMKLNTAYRILAVSTLLALAACGDKAPEPKPEAKTAETAAAQAEQAAPSDANVSEEDKALLKQAQGFFQPLPERAEIDPAKPITDAQIKLGHQLWYEPRLSRGNTVSCNTCHNLATGGVDNLPTSQGHKGSFGARNSPTALNAALLGSQFWDGRAKDVEEQAGGPLLNPVEMAHTDQAAVEKKIAHIPEYQAMFKEAFAENGGAVSFDNITKAIGAFERTLLTPSRWDDYLKGDVNALTEKERKGVRAFINNGCIACHKGVNLGGDSFQKFGLVKGPYWNYIDSTKHDEGLFEVTKNEADKYFFRVPGLRNVAKTFPYFHNGSVWELDKAISIMGETQLGKTIPQEEVDDMVAFMNALTGTVPEAARTVPELPLSPAAETHPDNN